MLLERGKDLRSRSLGTMDGEANSLVTVVCGKSFRNVILNESFVSIYDAEIHTGLVAAVWGFCGSDRGSRCGWVSRSELVCLDKRAR
jgi:hypothetical protein